MRATRGSESSMRKAVCARMAPEAPVTPTITTLASDDCIDFTGALFMRRLSLRKHAASFSPTLFSGERASLGSRSRQSQDNGALDECRFRAACASNGLVLYLSALVALPCPQKAG